MSSKKSGARASPSPEAAKSDELKQLGFVPEISGKVRVEKGSKPGPVQIGTRLDDVPRPP